jgi:hypothetical protein
LPPDFSVGAAANDPAIGKASISAKTALPVRLKLRPKESAVLNTASFE